MPRPLFGEKREKQQHRCFLIPPVSTKHWKSSILNHLDSMCQWQQTSMYRFRIACQEYANEHRHNMGEGGGQLERGSAFWSCVGSSCTTTQGRRYVNE